MKVMKVMKKLSVYKSSLLFILMFISLPSLAAISFDRTRIIYNEGSESVSLKVKNENKKLPYLAQAWVETQTQTKTKLFAAVPPIQRVEPLDDSVIRLMANNITNKVSKDRESVFYFNLREIPPKPEHANSLQLALQTRVKLFFRPKSIINLSKSMWQEKLKFKYVHGKFKIINDSPFYVTIINYAFNHKWVKGAAPFMIEPFSSYSLSSKVNPNVFRYVYVNDFGGKPNVTVTKTKGKWGYTKN
ncbi:fimbrial biogenesis chaperone [Photobacterium damselae]|uniref:fimbrial biogenesis chaperone n=1 Tax=Photobacterium damselae TaxID=38293 RepID=UPI001443B9B8|nr:molecular chaperone [Photobacterium damselae]